MKVAVLFSGGKDSAYATHLCLSWGWEVVWVTVSPQEDSMMFHHPNTKWCRLQAKAAGIKIHEIKTTHKKELEDLQKALKKLKIDGIITGAASSDYQRQRIEIMGDALGIPTFNPLWHKGEEFLKNMLEEMQVYIVSVSAEGLGEKWLAREFLPQDVEELSAMKPSISPYLEGGEGETFVTDAPFFKKRIQILEWKKSFKGMSGKAIIKKAKLVKK